MATEEYTSPGEYTLDTSSVGTATFTVTGAGGGQGSFGSDSEGGPGGPGGLIEGEMDLDGIDTLTITVGGGGGYAGFTSNSPGVGGSPDGGDGGSGGSSDFQDNHAGGGGGGRTTIETGSGDLIVEAGGGGGAGASDAGGGAGGGGGGGAGGTGGAGSDDGFAGEDASSTGASGGNGSDGDSFSASAGGPGGTATGSRVTSVTTDSTGGANNGGSRSDGGDGSVILETQEAPAAPTDLIVTTNASAIEADLSWTDNATEEEGHRVYRSTQSGAGVSGTLVAELPPATTLYTDTEIKEGERAYYTVYSYNSVGNSAPSNEESGLIPLPAPTDLTVTSVTSDTADLSWTDNATDETGYRVEVDPGDDGTWEVAEDLSPETESHTVTGLLNGQLYGARVIAVAPDDEAIDQ